MKMLLPKNKLNCMCALMVLVLAVHSANTTENVSTVVESTTPEDEAIAPTTAPTTDPAANLTADPATDPTADPTADPSTDPATDHTIATTNASKGDDFPFTKVFQINNEAADRYFI